MGMLAFREFSVSVGTGNTPFLTANKHRLGLILNNDDVQPYRVSFNGDATSTNGLKVPSVRPPIILAPGHWGWLLKTEMRAISPGGAITVTGYEIIGPDDFQDNDKNRYLPGGYDIGD